MLKNIFYIAILAFIVAGQYFFLRNFFIENELITNLVTFFSIIFGFYVTSLAIFATSKYVAGLYKITDKDNKKLTLLNTLLKNYKRGLQIILVAIVYLLILQFIILQTTNKFTLGNIFAMPFLAIIIVNFYYSYKMLNDLVKIIIQEAKNNSKSE